MKETFPTKTQLTKNASTKTKLYQQSRGKCMWKLPVDGELWMVECARWCCTNGTKTNENNSQTLISPRRKLNTRRQRLTQEVSLPLPGWLPRSLPVSPLESDSVHMMDPNHETQLKGKYFAAIYIKVWHRSHTQNSMAKNLLARIMRENIKLISSCDVRSSTISRNCMWNREARQRR